MQNYYEINIEVCDIEFAYAPNREFEYPHKFVIHVPAKIYETATIPELEKYLYSEVIDVLNSDTQFDINDAPEFEVAFAEFIWSITNEIDTQKSYFKIKQEITMTKIETNNLIINKLLSDADSDA